MSSVQSDIDLETTSKQSQTEVARHEDAGNVCTVHGDVGLSSGNIRTPAPVHIHGDVSSGTSVFSGASVRVDGTVHDAVISAGESINLTRGVRGSGRAIVRAKKNLETVFAERAILLAVGDMRIMSSCVRCDIRCNSSVYMERQKGRLVGGTVRARLGLELRDLGSDRGIRTEVSFGQNYLLSDRIESEEKELEKLKRSSADLTRAMRQSDRGGAAKEFEQMRKEKISLLHEIESKAFRILTLREILEKHYPSKIVVHGTLFPGVVVESHGRFYGVKQPRKRVIISFNPTVGRIEEKPLPKGSRG